MKETLFGLMQQKKKEQEFQELVTWNQKIEGNGLTLTEEEVRELMVCRDESLKRYRRVEFGKGILEKLMYVFCDSPGLEQQDYAGDLMRLQDIFYQFKNESADQLTDDELLHFMKEQLDGVCEGDMDYLSSTCLERFSRAVRAGYRGYQRSEGQNEYEKFDEEERWDKNLYMDVVKELFW